MKSKKFPLAVVTSTSLFVILFSLAIVSLVVYPQNGSVEFKFGMFCYGWLLWTLSEYFIHRFWEHKGSLSVNLKKNHSHHHRNPGNLRVRAVDRTLMLLISITLIVVSFYLNSYWAFVTGIFTGFSFFCFMHYFLHKPLAKKVLPRLLELHQYHHTKFPNLCFGVSTYFWDRVFNTMPKKEVEISARVKTFYFS